MFYPTFALALSAAVPALGLYLVFALLIEPALWMCRGLRLSVGLALAACALGLTLSWALDLPSRACIAVALSVLGLASAVPGTPSRKEENAESTTFSPR